MLSFITLSSFNILLTATLVHPSVAMTDSISSRSSWICSGMAARLKSTRVAVYSNGMSGRPYVGGVCTLYMYSGGGIDGGEVDEECTFDDTVIRGFPRNAFFDEPLEEIILWPRVFLSAYHVRSLIGYIPACPTNPPQGPQP